jgi:hypothetical protein
MTPSCVARTILSVALFFATSPALAQNVCTPSPITTVVPMSAVVGLGAHLADDGRGAYVDGSQQSSAVLAVDAQLIPTASGPVNHRSRYLAFNLNSPAESWALPLGIVADPQSELHVRYWIEDPDGVRQVHSIQELPDDGIFRESARTDILVRVGGVRHLLMFGGEDWPLNLCRPDLGPLLSTAGSTLVQIARQGDTFILQAPSGSKARLFDYSSNWTPVDKGLYNFSFTVTMSPKPTKGKK